MKQNCNQSAIDNIFHHTLPVSPLYYVQGTLAHVIHEISSQACTKLPSMHYKVRSDLRLVIQYKKLLLYVGKLVLKIISL